MNSYFHLVEQLTLSIQGQSNLESLSRDFVSELKSAHKTICERECHDSQNSKLYALIALILQRGTPAAMGLLKPILEVLYMKESPLLRIVYQFVPSMLRQYIQIKDNKNSDLEQAVKVIQANQLEKYQRYVRDNEQIRSSPFVRELYELHFNQQSGRTELDRSFDREEISFNSDRQRVVTAAQEQKTVLLFVIYRNLEWLSAKALKDYLHTVYVYCGGDNKDYESRASCYHLEKKNAFNPFKYSISDQEMEWMLVSLYELSIGSEFDKYELLAAINMVYKKTANESMFKFSEMAQSIIHILEDEYKDIFS